ncbi:MAG: hypothetical protein QGI45_11715 [Myxococcota bacterium]|jgi:hypothetical protein|nr:hypothetical protein [Myxococcota bacterium]
MRKAFYHIGLFLFLSIGSTACLKHEPATLKLCGESDDAQICHAGDVCLHGTCRQLCAIAEDCQGNLSCVDTVCVHAEKSMPRVTRVLGDSSADETQTQGSIVIEGAHLADATFVLQADSHGFGLDVISQTSTQAHLLLPADVRSGQYLLMVSNEAGTIQEDFSLNLPELSGDELLDRVNRASGSIALARLPIGNGLGQIAPGTHDHDDRYYSQEVMDSAFASLAETVERDFLSSAQAAQKYLPIDVAASDYVQQSTLENSYSTRQENAAEFVRRSEAQEYLSAGEAEELFVGDQQFQEALADLSFGPEKIRNSDFAQGLRDWQAVIGELRLEDVEDGPSSRYAVMNGLNEYVEGTSGIDIDVDQFRTYELYGAFKQLGLGSVGGYSLGVRVFNSDGVEIVNPETSGWWFEPVSGAEIDVENAGMDSTWVQEKYAFGFGSQNPFPENARLARLAFALNADNGTNGNRVFQVQGIGIRMIEVPKDLRWHDLQGADGADLSVEGFQSPQFRRIGDEVCLRGTLSVQLHDGSTQVVLPEGFRPPGKIAFNRVSYDSYWKSGTLAYEHTYFTQINGAGVLKNKHRAGHSSYSAYGNLRSAVHETHLNGICFSITP